MSEYIVEGKLAIDLKNINLNEFYLRRFNKIDLVLYKSSQVYINEVRMS